MNTTDSPKTSGIVTSAYVITLFFLALSGFGQMPIFKRYYIADIPGLAWLANFYVTHYIHYLGAVIILALTAYLTAVYLMPYRSQRKVTVTGYLRAGLLAGILVTGALLVIRNSLFAPFSPNTVIFLDLSHLFLVMLFLMVALFCLVFRKRWSVAAS